MFPAPVAVANPAFFDGDAVSGLNDAVAEVIGLNGIYLIDDN
ncbi:hypothetical protein [Candidatus Regiella endosymbiont of Tuberolachnus salignus]